MVSETTYRGRLAPSPTGYLHLGHARTFWTAHKRARQNGGTLVLRNEDLDPSRCRNTFAEAMMEDLLWFGITWDEGPDVGGPFGPYSQSARTPLYASAFDKLRICGAIYPCTCSRQDVQRATQAPHAGDDEPLYPGTCRPTPFPARSPNAHPSTRNLPVNWRFRVPDGEVISFHDGSFGQQSFTAGKDFGDFVVWRHDNIPSYQLAVVVDDAAMRITEVVRGADLLRSTARQILLFRALGLPLPSYYHCSLVTDENGVRLAKRHEALSLRKLRESGRSPAELRGEAKILAPGVRPAPPWNVSVRI